MNENQKIAVVIPCYKVKKHIQSVIKEIGPEVYKIIVVDDGCPEKTGLFVEQNISDSRIEVVFLHTNRGVGGAVIAGYHSAIKAQCDIIVKLDGDDQMDARLIREFVQPIINGEADYTKGNRFYELSYITQMPAIRLVGNSILSLINKFSSGYWNIMDPTNGYTAIHRSVLAHIPLEKIDNRYFFESDMLFRLGTLRAVVMDISIDAKYGGENSNLSILHTLLSFPQKYFYCFIKRIFYTYFLRDFNPGTIELVLGIIFFCFGIIFGGVQWYTSMSDQIPATSGTVMLSALPILIGVQFLLSGLNFDINNVPKKTFISRLDSRRFGRG